LIPNESLTPSSMVFFEGYLRLGDYERYSIIAFHLATDFINTTPAEVNNL